MFITVYLVAIVFLLSTLLSRRFSCCFVVTSAYESPMLFKLSDTDM